MKFFTLPWYDAKAPEAERWTIFDVYGKHLAALRSRLPPDVWELTQLRGVDDGLLLHAEHDRERKLLSLTLRCGDLQVGYYDLHVVYAGAEISPADEWALAQITRSTQPHGSHVCDVAYHELVVAEDERIEHGWLFHPGLCFTVTCRELRWEKIARPDRDFPPASDRFPGGPASSPGGEDIQDLAARKLQVYGPSRAVTSPFRLRVPRRRRAVVP